MATNTAGSVGSKPHTNQVGFWARAITYADDGSTLTLGVLPPGGAVIRGGVVVTTAFNAGSTNVLNIGTSADADGFATELALGTVGVIPVDEMATSNDTYSSSDITVTCTVDLTGTAAGTGAGLVWVEYIWPTVA